MKRKTRQQLDLLKLLVKKEIILRYKRTYLGFLWSLLNPLLTGFVLFIAFKIFMRFEMEDYTLFLLSALFPWTWFSVSVSMSTNTLIGNISLIKKVVFPKHFLLLATVIGQLVNFIFSLPILLVLVYSYGKAPTWNWLVAMPLLIGVQFIVCYGLALMVSMVNAFFRDMEHIINVLLSLLFWMTPILYPLEAVPERYRVYLSLNPATYLIQSWRDIFFSNSINWDYIFICMLTATVVFLAGSLVFKRLDRRLDEVL